MMASAAWRLPVAVSVWGSVAMVASIFSMGIWTPIRPVEQTRTCRGLMPRAEAVAAVIRLADSMPTRPVQALAFPALATIARTSLLRR